MKPYQLFPFRFKRFNNKVFVINETGEFIFLSLQQFNRMISYDLDTRTPIFSDLKSKHILTDTSVGPVINMLATKYRTKKSFLYNFTSLHMVVPTLRCNSSCRYCQVSSKSTDAKEYDMNKATAKKTVDMIFKSPSPVIKIEFQGGEPLLNLKFVKYIIEYAEKLNSLHKKHLEFVVCTNLTLVTEKMLKYFKNHNVYISTSLDGPKALHDKNRPLQKKESSYDIFLKNIEKVRQYLGPDSISALMTTTKDSLEQLPAIIEEYVKLGFHSIFLRALNPYGLAKKDIAALGYSAEDFVEKYKLALNYIIDLNLRGIHFAEIYVGLLLTRILTPFSTGFVDLQSPAGIAICGVIYDYNGNVYASDEGRMLGAMGDDTFLLGNVNSNTYKEIFYGDKIRSLIKNSCLECLPICSHCAFQSYCGADPVRNYVEQGDIIGNRMVSEMCKKNMGIIQYLLELIERNDKDINNVFWSWITRRPLSRMREKQEDVSF